MALTELQRPNKDEFYVKIKDTASRMRKTIDQWEALYEFIDEMATSDLDEMGMPTGQVRTDLVNFRNALEQIVTLWNGTGVAQPSIAPIAAINKVRAMY